MKISRISRIIKILMALETGRKFTIDELSKLFGLSRRTIFRDLSELAKAGVSYHIDAKTGRYSLDIKLANEYFGYEDHVDVSAHIGKMRTMQSDGKFYDVELCFSSQVALSIAKVRHHSTQTVSFEKDGSLIIKFRVGDVNESLKWILSFGDQVQILSPQILRNKVEEIVRRTLKLYEKDHCVPDLLVQIRPFGKSQENMKIV